MSNIDKKINNLKEISSKLENDAITLADSVKLFDEGVALAKDCYEELNEIKGKVTVLKKEIETMKEEAFI